MSRERKDEDDIIYGGTVIDEDFDMGIEEDNNLPPSTPSYPTAANNHVTATMSFEKVIDFCVDAINFDESPLTFSYHTNHLKEAMKSSISLDDAIKLYCVLQVNNDLLVRRDYSLTSDKFKARVTEKEKQYSALIQQAKNEGKEDLLLAAVKIQLNLSDNQIFNFFGAKKPEPLANLIKESHLTADAEHLSIKEIEQKILHDSSYQAMMHATTRLMRDMSERAKRHDYSTVYQILPLKDFYQWIEQEKQTIDQTTKSRGVEETKDTSPVTEHDPELANTLEMLRNSVVLEKLIGPDDAQEIRKVDIERARISQELKDRLNAIIKNSDIAGQLDKAFPQHQPKPPQIRR